MRTNDNNTAYGWVLVIAQFLLITGLVVLIFRAGYPVSLPGKVLAPLFLIMGIVLFVFTQYFNRPGNWSIHPHPKSQAQLIINGPYQLIRHPMYTAALLSALGATFWAPGVLSIICTLALLMVFVLKIKIEEVKMAAKFQGWSDYALDTKRLIPKIW